MSSNTNDYEWLISDAGRDHLARTIQSSSSGKSITSLVSKLRRELTPEQTHLILEQSRLRERAASKFSKADAMFFIDLRLQQSTSESIAIYKSSYFPDGPIADLCCGLGGDSIGLARRGLSVMVDRDPVCALLAKANLQAYGSQPTILCDDVSAANLEEMAAWHLDPDRRSQPRRTVMVDQSEPNDDAIDDLLRRNTNAAIKLAPACEVPDHWAQTAQLEWIGHDKECKQLVARFGELAEAPGSRTATVIGNDGSVTSQISGTGDESCEFASRSVELSGHLFEAHPAVRAAGLVNALGREHQLLRVPDEPRYLLGASMDPAMTSDQSLTGFEILDSLPFDRRKVKRRLDEMQVGHVEIKTHARNVDPVVEQKRMAGSGPHPVTLFVVQSGERLRAIVTKRIVAT